MTRRGFLGRAAAFAAGAATGGCAMSPLPSAGRPPAPGFMWAYLAQFGMKLWERRKHYMDMKLDLSLWNGLVDRAAEAGVNVFVFDLAEGMVFPSHPELAVRGSWEPERMKEEIARMKRMGMTAVPKLNFSTSHDQWLGKWRDYLSTPEYFATCREIIDDVAEVFDESPLLHLGFDEENFFIQDVNRFGYKRLRSGDAWWNDFLWFVKESERHGMRPWVWSDGFWEKTDEFAARMPRSVLQSNWYYRNEFDVSKLKGRMKKRVECYGTIDKAGFDQMPCGSTFVCRENFRMTAEYCRKVVSPDRLKGFFMAPWYYRTLEVNRKKIMESLDVVEETVKMWKRNAV